MMKRNIYLAMAILLIGFQVTLSAQNKVNRTNPQRPTPEQMLQYRSNQMAKALLLDDAATAKFVPLYSQYLKELSTCNVTNPTRRGYRTGDVKAQTNETKLATKPTLTDAEVEKQIKERFAQNRKRIDIQEKYYKKFRKFLTPKQIAKIYQKEGGNRGKFKQENNRRQNQTDRPGHRRQNR